MITELGAQQPPESTVSRMRLSIIAAVVVLAAGIGLVLGSVLLTGRGATLAPAAGYVPADAVMYFEARLDLPGEQRANLRAILERFPAVQPDDVLTDALGDTLDEALAGAQAPFDYSTDVAPWFDGTVALAVLDYPLNADPMQMELPSVVGLFGVRDPTGVSELAEKLRAELVAQGSTFSSSEHGGVTIWTLEVEPSAFMPMAGMGFAYAVTDDLLVLANGTSQVQTALDTASGGDSLANDSEVAALLADLPEERAGVAVVNAEAMMSELLAELDAVDPGLADAMAAYLEAIPALSVGTVAFADDAVVMDSVAAAVDGPLAPSNSRRALVERVPADALAFADGSNMGAVMQQAVVSLKATLAAGPMGAEQMAGVDQVEAALGAELEEMVDWIGSGAMAVGWDGQDAYFGLLLEAVDADAAERRLGQLGALAELAASDPSSGVTVSSETIDGVEVTSVHVAFPAFMGDLGEEPGLVVEYAIDGDVALVGIGEGFVGTAITLEPSGSLAQADRFRTAIDRFGGADNAGAFFVDLAALRESVESALPPEMASTYGEIGPNLEPLDYLAAVTRVEGDRTVGRLGLVLR